MSKKIFLILLILLILIPFATSETVDVAEYKSLVTDLSVRGKLTVADKAHITADLAILPLEDLRQEVIFFNEWSDPEANIEGDDTINYKWFSKGVLEFGYDSSIKTEVIMPGSSKVSFPAVITKYPEYAKPSKNIDSDDSSIVEKANEIVTGKNDLFKSVFSIAEFVYLNITYDENYKETVKKASWTLQNKKGVCDEFSLLFIALCRSLGIPARYVSGVAYSNIKDSFGNHAWAEVFLPGQGWIPFDTTYGQFGFIDSSHIALSKTIDSESSIIYTYPSNIGIVADDMIIDAQVTETLDKLTPKTSMRVKLLKERVMAGSYVPLKIEIKNLQPHYLPLNVYIIKAPSLVGKNTKQVLLEPNEEKTIFFILHAPKEDTEKGYVYTSKVEVKTSFNNLIETNLIYSKDNYDFFTIEKAQDIIEALTQQEEKYSYDLSLECEPDKKEKYIGEEIMVICNISNKGNVPLRDLNICIEECKNFDLLIGTEKSEQFILKDNETDYIVKVQGKQNNISKIFYFSVALLEKPDLEIISLNKKQLNYQEDNLILNIKTKSICKNAVIRLNNVLVEVGDIEGIKEITIPFAGKDALSEKIKISSECYDLRNRRYTDKKEFYVKITNVPGFAKIWQFFVKLFS